MKKLNVKKLVVVSAFAMMTCCMTGCTKREIVTIQPEETAFLIPLNGDVEAQASFESEELLGKAKVAAKQVEITQSTRRVGAFHWEYAPDNMLVIVSRTPVTREWSSSSATGTSTANQAIFAESNESIGFSVGINCSAQIDTELDAVRFLYSYNNKTLADIMDTEIRARVESKFVDECSKYTMDEILDKKEDIMNAVRDDVIPYFEERGITITVLGMKDGINYNDPSVQAAINASFVADREKEAQNVKNEAVIAKAQADAEAQRIEAEAKADANKTISESLTNELIEYEKVQKWNGVQPQVVSDSSAIVDMRE